MNKQMCEVLQSMYQHPDRACCYYSANGRQLPGPRFQDMPCWDWTPQLSRQVQGVSTCLIPLALGCPPCLTTEGKTWIKPLITDPRQVNDLVLPDIWSGPTGAVLKNISQLVAELPDGERIREPDIQSPLGVAELMWDESFYFAFYESPEALHQLLEKITTFTIRFIQEIKKLTGSRLNGAGFPLIWADEAGTMIADDTMSLISPDMHLAFSIPYVNRIADTCGPLFYHSCTWRKPYFDNIHQIRNVKAYNWTPGNSDDPADIVAEFSGKAVLAPHLCLNMHQDTDVLRFCHEKGLHFQDEFDLFRHIVDSMQENTSLYFWFSNVMEKPQVMEKIYDLCHQRGWTPAAMGLSLPHRARLGGSLD